MSTPSAPQEALSLMTWWNALSWDAIEAWKAEVQMTLLKCSGLDLWCTGQASLSRHSESIKIEKIVSLLGLILSMPFSRLFFKASCTLESAWSSSPFYSCCFTLHSVLKQPELKIAQECEGSMTVQLPFQTCTENEARVYFAKVWAVPEWNG